MNNVRWVEHNDGRRLSQERGKATKNDGSMMAPSHLVLVRLQFPILKSFPEHVQKQDATILRDNFVEQRKNDKAGDENAGDKKGEEARKGLNAWNQAHASCCPQFWVIRLCYNAHRQGEPNRKYVDIHFNLIHIFFFLPLSCEKKKDKELNSHSTRPRSCQLACRKGADDIKRLPIPHSGIQYQVEGSVR